MPRGLLIWRTDPGGSAVTAQKSEGKLVWSPSTCSSERGLWTVIGAEKCDAQPTSLHSSLHPLWVLQESITVHSRQPDWQVCVRVCVCVLVGSSQFRIPIFRALNNMWFYCHHYFSWLLCYCYVTSVVSDSVWPHRRQPTRLPRPWDSPGKNTGVGCHFRLQCRKVKSESKFAQSRPTLSDPIILHMFTGSIQCSFFFFFKTQEVDCPCSPGASAYDL